MGRIGLANDRYYRTTYLLELALREDIELEVTSPGAARRVHDRFRRARHRHPARWGNLRFFTGGPVIYVTTVQRHEQALAEAHRQRHSVQLQKSWDWRLRHLRQRHSKEAADFLLYVARHGYDTPAAFVLEAIERGSASIRLPLIIGNLRPGKSRIYLAWPGENVIIGYITVGRIELVTPDGFAEPLPPDITPVPESAELASRPRLSGHRPVAAVSAVGPLTVEPRECPVKKKFIGLRRWKW